MVLGKRGVLAVFYLKRRSGFTFIEVLAATAFFFIAFLALSGLLLQGYKTMGVAEKRGVALHYNQQEIEAVLQNLDPTGEVEVTRDEDYEMVFQDFGISVKGTLITVTYTIPGHTGGEIVYVTFIPAAEEVP